ncbi:translation initiation factor eIF4E3 [Magnaporthiopsis poae ATCC 64411]|uniref:Translation initiation factor eIF4E3 n=1 Tax=Magnaporthiopsis poae (strain ATCC 64411 / 73-15) TaxID=644358 RepID=A0A0C4E4I3_MAGP6|nr:translation initiation factor eIF4E3 [Magnaporthiopsis poae ATCC 64411]
MDNLWSRRTNSSKLSLSTAGAGPGDSASAPNSSINNTRNGSFSRRLGGDSSAYGKGPAPYNLAVTPGGGGGGLMSPGATTGGGASSAFGLGSGAFASFGSARTPKSPGNPFDFAMGGGVLGNPKRPDFEWPTNKGGSQASASASASTASIGPVRHTLRTPWVFWFRPPISKANGYIEYEKTLHAMAEVGTAEDFFSVYAHLKRPSALPLVSDYHLFRKGVRPIWEDDENRKGGKWIVRLKKGVADRYWEDLLFAIVGDQFSDASEEVCGAVLSVRNGEDILSVWVRRDGGKVVKIRETLKRVVGFPPDTKVEWKSHEGSIQQRSALDEVRRERAAANNPDKRTKHTQFAGGDDQKQQGYGGAAGIS